MVSDIEIDVIEGRSSEDAFSDDAVTNDIEMDDDLDMADQLLAQFSTGKAVKRPPPSDVLTPSKMPKLDEDEFMGKFGTLKPNFYHKRIDVSENCIHEVTYILLFPFLSSFIGCLSSRC